MSNVMLDSPVGDFEWVFIDGEGKPDLQGIPKYSIDLVLTPEQAEPFIAKVNAFWESDKPKGAKDPKSMDRPVIRHPQPLDRIHIGDQPQGVEFVIGIHPFHDFVQDRVVSIGHGHLDPSRESPIYRVVTPVVFGNAFGLESV